MKIINPHNVAEPIVRVMEKGLRPPSHDRYSVTSLVDSPLIRRLTIDRWNDIEVDAMERLWAVFSTVLHAMLADASVEDALAEERVECNLFGKRITGRIDVYQRGLIEDYKMASSFAFKRDMKIEWIGQQNIYAHMFRDMGFPVQGLVIQALIRDWMLSKAVATGEYPQTPMKQISLPLWSSEETIQYIKGRLDEHSNENPGICTRDERWHSDEVFAVMKEGNVKAVKGGLFEDEERAQAYAYKLTGEKKKKHYVEHRPGISKRCKWYCAPRFLCPVNPETPERIGDWGHGDGEEES